jgi:hypothetical protein
LRQPSVGVEKVPVLKQGIRPQGDGIGFRQGRRVIGLFAENLFHFADLALGFARNVFNRATVLKIGIARGASGFFLQFTFGFLDSSLGAILGARLHTLVSHVGPIEDSQNAADELAAAIRR